MKLQDARVDDSDYLCSLTKLTGLKIEDVEGYISKEFGDPVFKLCHIRFVDGTRIDVEGEHDMPYISGDLPNVTTEQLQDLYNQNE